MALYVSKISSVQKIVLGLELKFLKNIVTRGFCVVLLLFFFFFSSFLTFSYFLKHFHIIS
jgi:hypothetical protein